MQQRDYVTDKGIVVEKHYAGDAGWDIRAAEDILVEARGFATIPTNFKVDIPDGYFGLIQERSSIGSKGLFTMGNVIDAGYDGYLGMTVGNLGEQDYWVLKGDRIAQIILIPCITGCTKGLRQRGERGFGSTGN